LAGWFVLYPSRDPIDAGEQQRYAIETPQGRLACFVHQTGPDAPAAASARDAAPPPDLLVLKLPGTGGRGERSSRFPGDLLPHLRSEIWTWNPPGYGESTGRASLTALASAVVALFDEVIERRYGPETRIWLAGNSLGCALASHLASQRHVDGMLLRNPPPLVETIEASARNRYPGRFQPLARAAGRWLARGVPPPLDLLCTASRCHAPAIFMQSEQDRLVPPSLQRQVHARYAGPWRLLTMPGLEHEDPPSEADIKRLTALLPWLWEQGTVQK
jgi:pimeloyl-ACP methyl ester carboxylesterase